MWAIYIAISIALFSSIGALTSDDRTDPPLVVADPMITRGLEWLWQHRELDFGYKDLTAKAVTTLQLANASGWYSQENVFSITTIKQMEVELLLQLSRHHETPTVPTEIAAYCLALSSLCMDPRQFHSFDLIGILLHHELLLDWELSMGSLAVCTSGAHVRKRQLRRLLDITEAHEQLPIETLSMVMIALNCIVHDHRNRNLQHYLLSPTKAMGKFQKENGSFGSLKQTAWAVQALQASDPSGHYWNKSAALAYVRSTQQENGAFGDDKDIEDTMLSLLALGPRSLANIKDLSCHPEKSDDWSSLQLADLTLAFNFSMGTHHSQQHTNRTIETNGTTVLSTTSTSTTSVPPTSDNGKITVSYTLWLGNNASSSRTINVTTDAGSNFYRIMQIAAQEDSNFAFESTVWPNGHYINTIADCKEEPMTYHYWLLYRLSNQPSMENPPSNQFVAPFGVDDLIVQNHEYYLFWFKKL